jgi:hypothetical protein
MQITAAFVLWAVALTALALIGDWRVAGAVFLTCKVAGIVALLLPLPRRLRRRYESVQVGHLSISL